MKKHEVRRLEGIVETLGHRLRDNPYDLHGLETLLLGCIELARTGKAWQATSIAIEVSSFIASAHSNSISAERHKAWVDSVKAQSGSSIGIVGDKQVWWRAGDAPKPAATVEQMRAAADAAMAADEEMDEYECDACHKTTLVPMDSGTPKGWQPSDNPDGEEYICNECHTFGRPGKP